MKFKKDLLFNQKLKTENFSIHLYECHNIFDGLFYMIELKNEIVIKDLKTFSDLKNATEYLKKKISLDNKKYLLQQFNV